MLHRPRTHPVAVLTVLALIASSALLAQGPGRDYAVTITNVTPGQVFGPPVVVVHTRNFSLFELGEPASPGLAILAEDAAVDTLFEELEANPEVVEFVVAGDPLMPGDSVTLEVHAQFPHHFVTTAQMLVTTNDAFFALNGVRVPQGKRQDPRNGIRTFLAVAYDAGSEVNSESCDTIPGPPCGNTVVRDQEGSEGYVHVHSGIHGIGDLPPEDFGWHNPVAQVTVERLR